MHHGESMTVWQVTGIPPRDGCPAYRVQREATAVVEPDSCQILKVVSYDAQGAATPSLQFRETMNR